MLLSSEFCTIGHVGKVRKKMIERAGDEKLEFFFVGTQIEQNNCHNDTNWQLKDTRCSVCNILSIKWIQLIR